MTTQDKIKALVDAFVNEPYGATITHQEIAAIIREPYNSQMYGPIVSIAKKELVKSGKMIQNVYKVGYRVAFPDEYVDESAKRVRRGVRQIDKGVKVLEYAPVKDMTPLGAQTYHVTLDRTRIAQAALHGAKVEINMLTKKRKNPLLEAMDH